MLETKGLDSVVPNTQASSSTKRYGIVVASRLSDASTEFISIKHQIHTLKLQKCKISKQSI